MINDPNLPLSHKLPSMKSSAPDAQLKLQEEARTTVIDGTPSLTPWLPVTDDLVDANASRKEPASAINPTQGFVKHPAMPKTPSNASLKINY